MSVNLIVACAQNKTQYMSMSTFIIQVSLSAALRLTSLLLNQHTLHLHWRVVPKMGTDWCASARSRPIHGLQVVVVPAGQRIDLSCPGSLHDQLCSKLKKLVELASFGTLSRIQKV